MASIRELRSRIKSVSSTKKITKAQELIATSRITRAQARVAAALPYSREITAALEQLASRSTNLDHVLIKERAVVRRSGVLVITSDRGMCGGYNNNVLREAQALIKLLTESGKEVELFTLGAKGIAHYAYRGTPLGGAWSGFSQEPSASDVRAAQRFLQDLLTAGSEQTVRVPSFPGIAQLAVNKDNTEIAGIDELYLVSTHFVSMLSQKPVARRLAPLEVKINEIPIDTSASIGEDIPSGQGPKAQYDFEPEAEELLDLLLPKYLAARIFSASLDAAASESAARRAAMKSATDNATELERSLKQKANLARQAQITSEISEIVGTTAALGS